MTASDPTLRANALRESLHTRQADASRRWQEVRARMAVQEAKLGFSDATVSVAPDFRYATKEIGGKLDHLLQTLFGHKTAADHSLGQLPRQHTPPAPAKPGMQPEF